MINIQWWLKSDDGTVYTRDGLLTKEVYSRAEAERYISHQYTMHKAFGNPAKWRIMKTRKGDKMRFMLNVNDGGKDYIVISDIIEIH
jgi:hypothetical protein